MLLLLSRRFPTVFVYRSSLILYSSKILSFHFTSGFGDGERGGHKKKVIEWEPKDSLSTRKTTNDHIPSIKQTQKLPISNSSDDQKKKLQENIDISTKDRGFLYEFEVDDFIANSLRFCTLKNISDLMNNSAKASKWSKKSLLIKHLPAIGSQIKDKSSSSSTFWDISKIIYGMQHITANDAGAIDILSAMTTVTAKALKSGNITPPMGQDVSMLLYGLQGMTSEGKVVRRLLSVVADMIAYCDNTFKPQAFGNSLYGLQSMSSDSSEVRKVLSVLVIKIRNSKKDLDPQAVGNALYGMQKMNSDCSEVREMLSALAVKIRNSKEGLDAQAVGNALYGLQKMSSDSSEVREMLSVLALKIRNCKEDLRAQAVGNALYGLQGMSSDSSEVREVLSALVVKIRKCKEELDGQHVGNALYGLQKMSSDSSEVREVLSALVLKIRNCKDLNVQAVDNGFHGIKGMSRDCPEVRDVVSALEMKIRNHKDNLIAQDLCSELYGLQGMRSDASKVRHELSALMMKLGNIKKDLNAQAMSNILFGLQGIIWINSTPNFISIMKSLNRQVITIVEGFSRSTDKFKKQLNGSKIDTKDLVTLCQSLTLFLPDILVFHDMKKYKVMDKLNGLIKEELMCRIQEGDVYYKLVETQSKEKERMHKIVKKRFEDTAVDVRSNVYLFDLFESDIIILIPSDGDSTRGDTTISIEVDSDHTNERKRTFCERKDKYLKSKDVFVLRMDVSSMNGMNDIEIEEWVMSGINSIGSELSNRQT